MRTIHLAILGLALSWATALSAVSTCLTIDSLNFNSAYVIQLINNPNSITPNGALGILTAHVTNNNAVPLVNPGVILNLTEPGNPDCGGNIFLSPLNFTVHRTFQPHESAILVATDFTGNGGVSLCQAFVDEINSQFQNINPNNASGAVTQFLRRQFKVTLGGCNLVGAGSASTIITISNPPKALRDTVAQLVLPQDNAQVGQMPIFVWTPAVSNGISAGIDYMLVISRDASGVPWATIPNIAPGQTFYQWQASDPILPAGRLYWNVVSRRHGDGSLVGGQNGHGCGAPRAFSLSQAQSQAGNCAYSLGQLDAYVRTSAGPKAKLLDGLTLQQVLPADMNDPDLCALLGQAGGSAPGKVRLLDLSVTRR